jgi:N4-(beta-N-acetylglucosaminyl)-L-asparaginase
VGFGGSPDEAGETTLDALVMDGDRMRAGAVAGLRRIRRAATAARLVLEHSRHTLLAGDQAAAFAAGMGLEEGSLSTEESRRVWQDW